MSLSKYLWTRLYAAHRSKEEPNGAGSCGHEACSFVGKLNTEHISIWEYGDTNTHTYKHRERERERECKGEREVSWDQNLLKSHINSNEKSMKKGSMLSFLLSPLLFSCVTCLHILLIITTKAKGKKCLNTFLIFLMQINL